MKEHELRKIQTDISIDEPAPIDRLRAEHKLLQAERDNANSSYDRLRGIYNELTDNLRSVFSGSDPILPGFSPPGKDMGKETIRLAKEYKLLQDERDDYKTRRENLLEVIRVREQEAERNRICIQQLTAERDVLREFVEACSRCVANIRYREVTEDRC